MLRYQRNNIVFRIASSTAISQFKSSQAHTFLQLSRKDLHFNESAREIVLLEYDRFSQWFNRIERICMVTQEGKMPPAVGLGIRESCHEEIKTIETVLDAYPDVFCPQAVSFVKLVHQEAHNVILTRLEETMLQTVDRTFQGIVRVISDYLQHVLSCLHEFNNNYLDRDVATGNFLCITDFNGQEHRFGPIKSRAEFFKNLGCGPTYTLKDYTDLDLYDEVASYLGPNITLRPEPTDEPQKAYA